MTIYADDEFKVTQVRDILDIKLVKRGIDIACLEAGEVEERGGGKLVQLHLDRVKEIIALNKSGKKPQNLDKFIHLEPEITEPQYENVVGQDELTRFDGKFSKSQRKKRGNKNKRRKPNSPKSNMKNLTVSKQKGTNSNEKPSPQHKTNAKRQNKNK